MNSELKDALLRCETDFEGVMKRLSGDEELYCSFLKMFMDDTDINDLDKAIKLNNWDNAFTAVHAIKGVAGNMGFVPLFHAASKMVIIIRAGKIGEIASCYQEVRRCYNEIYNAINGCLQRPENQKTEGEN